MQNLRALADPFTLALLATVLFSYLMPCAGLVAQVLELVTYLGVAALFFLHGAKLAPAAVLAGARNWRLHLVVVLSTFCLFPLLGLALRPALEPLVTPELYLGILLLCTLPSTVQSSIAFVSIARGNVPAAICSAAASSLIGIVVTPLLVGLIVIERNAGMAPWKAISDISLQLLLPFICGQIARRWIGAWIGRHPRAVKLVDQGPILLVVYTAFSAALNEGLWQQIPLHSLAGLVAACLVLLVIALLLTRYAARVLGFDRKDEIAIVFCGSKKSLATGATIAKLLFPLSSVGVMLLPVMLFHQIQLMLCAVIAQKYAMRQEPGPKAESSM